MADSQDDKLYKAEYAKSGRASCKKCKENIAKDSLRMAIMVQVRNSVQLCPHVSLLRRFVQKESIYFLLLRFVFS